ncbi:hypothetical protein SNEBB_003764 [Seison nebaliae]|nr:hypothetical protein SNEBB_003764 [Seison nebaliae]
MISYFICHHLCGLDTYKHQNENYCFNAVEVNIYVTGKLEEYSETCSSDVNGMTDIMKYYDEDLIDYFQDSVYGVIGVESNNGRYYWADRFRTEILQSCTLWSNNKPTGKPFIYIDRYGKIAAATTGISIYCMKFQLKKLSFKLKSTSNNNVNRKNIGNIMVNLNSVDPKILMDSSDCYNKSIMINNDEYEVL